MKKLLVLLVAVALAILVYRRLSASQGSDSSLRPHQHGTPDHWPPVVRKPGTEPASAA
jgi:hypothetical protein